MLVLTCKEGDETVVSYYDNSLRKELQVVIKILAHNDHRVKVGFSAPSEFNIVRSEVLKRYHPNERSQANE